MRTNKRIFTLKVGLELSFSIVSNTFINYTNADQEIIGCVSLSEKHLNSLADHKLNMKQSWDSFEIKANIMLEIVDKICKLLL